MSAAPRSFKGLPLGGVARLDAADASDPQEALRLDGPDQAAHGSVRLPPAGDGVHLVGPEDVESRGEAPVGRDVSGPGPVRQAMEI